MMPHPSVPNYSRTAPNRSPNPLSHRSLSPAPPRSPIGPPAPQPYPSSAYSPNLRSRSPVPPVRSPQVPPRSPNALAFSKSMINTGFQVEKASRPPSRNPSPYMDPNKALPPQNDEYLYQNNVSALIGAKARPFSASGIIPADPSSLTVFFRSQSGITHSLDFPIDVDYYRPPSLDVLIAACLPHATCELDGFSDRESLFYPTNLPVSTTIELSNHPILDAVRDALFPNLPVGEHLVAVRDKLEVIPLGGHMCPQRRIADEGRVATIIVTLPVRFSGGALLINDFDGGKEKYYGRGGKGPDLEWTAFLNDCDHEVETVDKGVRVTMSYKVYIKSYSTPTAQPNENLIIPSDRFLDFISPILNMSRGSTIAFYLTERYNQSPSENYASALVSHLKGGDELLFNALKLYRLAPELRWVAGGFIWPAESFIDFSDGLPLDGLGQPIQSPGYRRRSQQMARRHGGGFAPLDAYGVTDDDEDGMLTVRQLVEQSGGMSIEDSGIVVLADETVHKGYSRSRVPYPSNGGLDKLIINVLMVVFVP